MDQKELRELEKQCIQEEAPACTAACPLHLDVRSLIQRIQKGDWPGAWKVLRKTMPFPGILGRICDAPCREYCKRREVDEPVAIGALEWACVSRPAPPIMLPPRPRKDQQVVVFGSGISSLTVCWDLARKGYAVTVVEPGDLLGGPLHRMEPERLASSVIEEETAILAKMEVRVQYQAPALTAAFLAQCRKTFDAVYIGLDAVPAGPLGLQTGADGAVHITDGTQCSATEGVFAGGCSARSAASIIWQAAEGRWAATSMDRYLQKVSLTAGRDKDAPYITRLYTSIQGVASAAAVAMTDPKNGYTESEALTEARRCLLCECLECVKVCPYLAHYRGYPKKYAREIYNNASIVMGARHANHLINSCSLCGLCEQVCPETFAMPDLILHARQSMVRRAKMPPSAHEFALLDMAFSQSEAFALARHQPHKSVSTHLFFPGCQLCASSPEAVFQIYQLLCHQIPDGVGLMLDCCAAPAHWAGRQDQFQAGLASWRQKWMALGRPQVIPACTTCHRMFTDYLPEVPLISLWQLLLQFEILPAGAPLKQLQLAVHDSCTARRETNIQTAVRHLLTRAGVSIEELPLSGAFTECCGFGGLMQNAHPAIARQTVQRRAALSTADYVTYCGMCRDNLAATGKRVLHVLDILLSDSRGDDPAARPRPGWSRRRENRQRLTQRFKEELWMEPPADPPQADGPVIRISDRVRAQLEQRRILDEDLQQVILQVRQSGQAFFNPRTGRYKASCKPRQVTFWIEYSEDQHGIEVHNAYCHRMEVRNT